MASELEIDKWEIIDTWASYYHENQHEIDGPTDDSRTIVAPFVETCVEQQHVQKNEQTEVNPDIAFDVEMLAHIEVVYQRSEQIADVGEAGGAEQSPEQRHKYKCLGYFESIDDYFLKFASVFVRKMVQDGFLDDVQQTMSCTPDEEVPCRAMPDTA